MKISVQNKDEKTFPCDALILPLIENEGIRPYANINKTLNGLPADIIASGEFNGHHNELSLLHTKGKIRPERILLIGLGKRNEVTREKLRQAGGKAASFLKGLNTRNIALSTKTIASLKLMPADFLEGCLLSAYSFQKYKKKEKKSLNEITILSSNITNKEIQLTGTLAASVSFARDLVNTPANDMTPSILVKHARKLKDTSLKVITKKQAEKLGMGAFLSVARGSTEPLKFLEIRYRKKNVAPVVVIGKSVTFDSGGISLKPSHGMEKMKYDMAGGAAVLGVMKAVSELKLPLHVIGILPATENLPSGNASKPGDVVKVMGGKTVEIISTDAEGRLTLADAIEYAKRFRPSAIIDIATLTGACPVALGSEAIALMGNNQSLIDKMINASRETDEKVWQMPLFDEYGEYIKSDVADLKNSSGRNGSLVTSGYFLKEFAGDIPWIHLDIAGTAWTDKDKPYIPKGATGIGVRLLLEFLKNT